MEDLRSLVGIMRPGEKSMLRHLLSRGTNAEDNLRWELFEMLIPSKKFSDEQVVAKFTKDASASAFSHLKKRLREDILSVLLIKESPKRIAQSNRAAQFECVKKIAQAYVLIFRGAKKQGAAILKTAEQLAIKYELAAELVTIHHITREALFSFTDGKQLNTVNAAIRMGLERWSDILRSEELSYLLTLPQLKTDLLLVEDDGFEERLIGELQELYEKSGAARVGFWYYMADVENSIATKRFDNAINQGVKFLQLVEDSPAIRSKNNIAGVNQSLGFACLNLRYYDDAKTHLTRSESLFPVGGFNRLQCLRFLFQVEIGSERFESALRIVEIALSHPRIETREHLKPQWLFMKASVEFLTGDLNSAFKTLNLEGYLVRQQDEWNVQFRILEMLILVEYKDEAWLEFRVDAVRKFLTRHKKLAAPRVKAAVDLIGNLLRRELDFDAISEKNVLMLSQCLNEEEDYEWNPSGIEIVRFDNWLNKKRSSTQRLGE